MEMRKKLIAFLSAAVLALGSLSLVGCAKKDNSFTIAFLSAGRGETYVQALVDEFKKTDAWKDYLKEKNLEDLEVKIISGPTATVVADVESSMNTGKYPDVFFFNYGMTDSNTTETLVSNKQLVKLDELLNETVPGENVKLKDVTVTGTFNCSVIAAHFDKTEVGAFIGDLPAAVDVSTCDFTGVTVNKTEID